MPKSITDLPVHVCRACGAVWMADDKMYEDPDRCPHCGTYGPVDVPGDTDPDEDLP